MCLLSDSLTPLLFSHMASARLLSRVYPEFSSRILTRLLSCSLQVIVKKVSQPHRWYLEHDSCDQISCWKEQILLSARGFSVFFQMLVKAQKVGSISFLVFFFPPIIFCINGGGF